MSLLEANIKKEIVSLRCAKVEDQVPVMLDIHEVAENYYLYKCYIGEQLFYYFLPTAPLTRNKLYEQVLWPPPLQEERNQQQLQVILWVNTFTGLLVPENDFKQAQGIFDDTTDVQSQHLQQVFSIPLIPQIHEVNLIDLIPYNLSCLKVQLLLTLMRAKYNDQASYNQLEQSVEEEKFPQLPQLSEQIQYSEAQANRTVQLGEALEIISCADEYAVAELFGIIYVLDSRVQTYADIAMYTSDFRQQQAHYPYCFMWEFDKHLLAIKNQLSNEQDELIRQIKKLSNLLKLTVLQAQGGTFSRNQLNEYYLAFWEQLGQAKNLRILALVTPQLSELFLLFRLSFDPFIGRYKNYYNLNHQQREELQFALTALIKIAVDNLFQQKLQNISNFPSFNQTRQLSTRQLTLNQDFEPLNPSSQVQQTMQNQLARNKRGIKIALVTSVFPEMATYWSSYGQFFQVTYSEEFKTTIDGKEYQITDEELGYIIFILNQRIEDIIRREGLLQRLTVFLCYYSSSLAGKFAADSSILSLLELYKLSKQVNSSILETDLRIHLLNVLPEHKLMLHGFMSDNEVNQLRESYETIKSTDLNFWQLGLLYRLLSMNPDCLYLLYINFQHLLTHAASESHEEKIWGKFLLMRGGHNGKDTWKIYEEVDQIVRALAPRAYHDIAYFWLKGYFLFIFYWLIDIKHTFSHLSNQQENDGQGDNTGYIEQFASIFKKLRDNKEEKLEKMVRAFKNQEYLNNVSENQQLPESQENFYFFTMMFVGLVLSLLIFSSNYHLVIVLMCGSLSFYPPIRELLEKFINYLGLDQFAKREYDTFFAFSSIILVTILLFDFGIFSILFGNVLGIIYSLCKEESEYNAQTTQLNETADWCKNSAFVGAAFGSIFGPWGGISGFIFGGIIGGCCNSYKEEIRDNFAQCQQYIWNRLA